MEGKKDCLEEEEKAGVSGQKTSLGARSARLY